MDEIATTQDITLIRGDCLEEMKKIPDKSIDLVLTDPPYGIGYQSNMRIDKFDVLKNDNIIDLRCIQEFSRLLKDSGALYLYTRWDVYPEWKKGAEEYFKIKNCIVWDKKTGGMGDLSGSFAPSHEFCLLASKGNHKLNGKRIRDVWEFSRENEEYQHPTQKPKGVMYRPIEYSCPMGGGVVLDPYMGSGTTGVACKELGRRFIGIEIEQKYFDIAQRRINQATRNLL